VVVRCAGWVVGDPFWVPTAASGTGSEGAMGATCAVDRWMGIGGCLAMVVFTSRFGRLDRWHSWPPGVAIPLAMMQADVAGLARRTGRRR
jgi:hypothetical protein